MREFASLVALCFAIAGCATGPADKPAAGNGEPIAGDAPNTQPLRSSVDGRVMAETQPLATRPATPELAGSEYAGSEYAGSEYAGSGLGGQSLEIVPDRGSAAAFGDAYQIGAQDLLEINVFGVPELSGAVRVNARGVVLIPLLGPVEASGLTSEELAEKIAEELAKDYLQDPHVTVFITEYSSQRVTIEGAVARPGIFVLSDRTTLLQGIALAQGLDQLADTSNVKLFREQPGGEKLALSFDLSKIRSGDVEDPLLRGSDIVVIQKSPSRLFLRDSIFRDAVDFLNPFSRLPGL